VKGLLAIALSAVLLLLLLSSCATTGFLGFLATTKYVDGRLEQSAAAAGARLDQTRQELAGVTADMERFKQQAARIETLGEEVERAQALVRELESRLGELPAETLRRLAGLIQEYLDSGGD